MNRKLFHQTNPGSALLTALFIMAMITISVTAISLKLKIDIAHTNLAINNDKRHLAAEIVTFWAIDRLKDTVENLTSLDDNGTVLIFPKKIQKIYPKAKISGRVLDLQAKFNLNNIADPKYQNIFYLLLKNTFPNFNSNKINSILAATKNWITGIVKNINQDEWVKKYLKEKPVYLPAYQKIQSVSEFRAIYGVDKNIYLSLVKYICALPQTTTININTASKHLLLSLANGIKANNIIKLRNNKKIQSVDEVSKLINNFKTSKDTISTESSYYLVTAYAEIDDITLTSFTTLKRVINKDNTISIDVIKQTFKGSPNR